MNTGEKSTHFGYQRVPEAHKAERVGEVFSSVATKYDLMNDLMSFGAHRLWKWFTVRRSGVRAGDRVLDVAAGSGDLARAFAARVGPGGAVIATDINDAMLSEGRRRLTNRGLVGNVHYVLADAERLPFASNYFDCISIGFGLRNVTRKDRALASMRDCLRPGGRVLVLEFSRPVIPLLQRASDAWSFNAIPALGQWIVGDRDSYQYLVESIRMHPPQEKMKQIMLEAGFDRVTYHNLSGGIVSLHIGYKF